MVLNLLIGTAEDQDHLENILTEGLSELTELKMNRKASRKVAWSTTTMVQSPFCVTE